jgi:DNA-binding NarL/FixJ family response regulator
MLEHRVEFQVISQASDGLEANQQAQELQSDLVVLDIGLPMLNGIEAGRRIRVVSNSKILFFSQEFSTSVLDQAFLLGGHGYLRKSDTDGELMLAVDAVVQGRKFVSSRLKPYVIPDSAR